MRAAARMSAPPVRALGPRLSPSRKTPSSEPMRGSMLSRTPACDAGTWVSPQFPEQGGGGGAKESAGCKGEPGLQEMTAMGGGPKGWR